MNVTLSADEKLIQKSREYARKHQTTLNRMIRDYLKQLTSEQEAAEAAGEFAALAQEEAGESAPGYRFNRDELYDRG